MHPNHAVRFNLAAAAHAAMIERGFKPDFPAGTDQQLAEIQAQPALPAGEVLADLRGLLWSSIDNDTSKDLDQIEWAEQLADGRIRVRVGVADVDARVRQGTVIDNYAQIETTSVYTGVKVFPMLPSELSEGATSLNENEDRAAMVIEFCVDAAGAVNDGKAYRGLVRNRAQLAYNSVGAWLEGKGAAPAKVAASADLAAQLKLQDAAAQRMLGGRFQHGALDLETIETRPVMLAEEAVEIAQLEKNRATSLIEEFMVAANGVVARMLETAGVASIRRVVRTPKRWERIVELAARLGAALPAEPDSKALNDFLLAQKRKDPDHFADLSLAVVKLMGPGEYVLVKPNEISPGHFGLAVAGLYTFDGAQPALPRHGDAAAGESVAGALAAALLREPTRDHRSAQHRDGGRGAQGGAGDAKAHCSGGAGQAHRAELRGNCDGREQLREVCAHAGAARGGDAGAGRKRAGRGRPGDGEAGLHRSRAGVHRLCGMSGGNRRIPVERDGMRAYRAGMRPAGGAGKPCVPRARSRV